MATVESPAARFSADKEQQHPIQIPALRDVVLDRSGRVRIDLIVMLAVFVSPAHRKEWIDHTAFGLTALVEHGSTAEQTLDHLRKELRDQITWEMTGHCA